MEATSSVHPSSIIEGEVEIGHGVKIGPFCHIIGPAKIGKQTTIGSNCYIQGPVVIGERNRINPHCIIGTGPESKSAEPTGKIIIGNDNILTELTVVQRGTGDRDTEIGNGNFLMDNVHIAHDNKLGDDITIAPNVVLAGHVVIQDGATVGIGSSVHQFSTIGAYCMIGMNSIVTKDIPPFALVAGSPAEYLRWNTYQLEKLGLGEEPSGELFQRCMKEFEQLSRRKVISID